MKGSVKSKAKRGATRDLFAELSEGIEALAEARHGKRTLSQLTGIRVVNGFKVPCVK